MTKPPVARKLAVGKCPTASFLATGGFKFKLFQNACMVYAVVAAFHIYSQRGEVDAKRGGWNLCIK